MRSINKNIFKDKFTLKQVKKQNTQRYINGQLVSVNSDSFKIQNAASILRKNDALPIVEPTDGDDIFMPKYDIEPYVAGTDGDDIFMPKNMFAQSTENKPANIATSIAVLEAIGITPLPNQDRDFSFLKTQNMTTLSNPNILETNRIKNLKNENIKADKNFKNFSNSFYNLDEGVSIDKSKQFTKLEKQKEIIDSSNLVTRIFDLNIVNSSTKCLRQFK